MSRPYFTVAINCYNYGRFVGQAIDSVLAQDFPASEVELIAVDDGSTDDSREVIARYKDKVRLIAQRNQGQAAAVSAGLSAGTGRVRCPLDADDIWLPGKLSALAEAFKDPTVALVQHFQREVDVDGRELPHALPSWPPYYTIESVLSGRVDYGAMSSIALRAEVLEKILPIPKDLFVFSDTYLVDFGLLHGRMANLARVLGYHRLHGKNNWAKTYESPDKLRGTLREAARYREYLEPRLEERGLPWGPRHFALLPAELVRRELLLAVHEGRRLDALALLPKMWRAAGGGRFAFFRCATCLVAVVSPKLYLSLLSAYEAGGWPARVREKVAP